jgi:ribosome-binding protein aMBF1 (putative translation factor)
LQRWGPSGWFRPAEPQKFVHIGYAVKSGKEVSGRNMYANIKLQIFRKGIHQNQLAQRLGIDETLLSKIIRGFREPSKAQRKQLADYLQASEQWLFDKSDATDPLEVLAKTEPRPGSADDGD